MDVRLWYYDFINILTAFNGYTLIYDDFISTLIILNEYELFYDLFVSIILISYIYNKQKENPFPKFSHAVWLF